MLINLDSRLNGSVTVKLTFDDDTAKEQIIKRGMKLGLTYRDNNTKYTKIGIVKCIKILSTNVVCQDGHRRHREVDWFESKKPKFVFVMDFSKDYKSDVVEVLDTNIVDIVLLQSDDKMELLNMFNTCKETINNDENQYTEESWQYYSSVLDIIKTAILDDPSKNATHASAGINILNNAIMSLVPVEEPDTPTDEPVEEPETPVEEPETPPADDTPTEDHDKPVEDPETPVEEPETPSTEEGETENENPVEQETDSNVGDQEQQEPETPVVDESVNSTVEEDLNGDNEEAETRS